MVVGGALVGGAIASLAGPSEDRTYAGFFVCGMLSGLVFFGAFAMAWPVGVAALVGAIVLGVVFVAASLEDVKCLGAWDSFGRLVGAAEKGPAQS